jgi:hypothetical protein
MACAFKGRPLHKPDVLLERRGSGAASQCTVDDLTPAPLFTLVSVKAAAMFGNHF